MQRTIVIDTCCTLNLLATRRELEIVRALELHLLETPQVRREPLVLWTPPDADGIRNREPTSTEALRQAELLATHPFEGPAVVDAFIAAAARIKDTDASCIALAGVLQIPLMTDDRKERNVARELFPSIELVSTLDVLASAAEALAWSDKEIVLIASDLRQRGNFAPPRKDPRGAWYAALLRGGGSGR
jgi:predicted nucleic acid-binding protein